MISQCQGSSGMKKLKVFLGGGGVQVKLKLKYKLVRQN